MPVTARDLALARLSAAAYSDTASGLPAGFTPVGTAELGFSPTAGESFENGVYHNGNAAALVAAGPLAGSSTLVLAFRGSDDREDSINSLRDINADYPDFAHLIAAVNTYAETGGFEQLVVTGHSLGGAMTQLYMADNPAAAAASTFGSPGALITEGEDPRIRNVAILDDPAVYLGENRAAVGEELRDDPFLAGAAIFAASDVFPGLTPVDAAESLDSLTVDYENRGETVPLPGAGGRSEPIAGVDEVFTASPEQHDVELYVARLAAAVAVAAGQSPEPLVQWRNADGSAMIWQLEGMSVVGESAIANPGDAWTMAGTGDFDGDARSDLLWQGADGTVMVWEMQGTAIVGGGIAGNPGNAWTMAGTGDFDGDARSDLLWQGADGSAFIWQMNGAAVVGGGVVGSPGSGWSIADTGDFDGDGRSDILWRGADGAVAIWRMNGTAMAGGEVIGNPGTSWTVAATGDYDRDDRSEILWHGADGSVMLWDTDGTAVTGGGQVAAMGTDWQIVA